jgi:hypothetical protein
MTADSVEWDTVQPMSMPTLLDRVNLHDTYLVAFGPDRYDRVTVEIWAIRGFNRWIPIGFDILLCRFDKPYGMRWVRSVIDMGGRCIQEQESRVLDSEARHALLSQGEFDMRAYEHYGGPLPTSDPTLTRTRLEFVDLTTFQILHGGAVRAVVVNSESRALDMSTLAGAST